MILPLLSALGAAGLVYKFAPRRDIFMTSTGIPNTPDNSRVARNLAWTSMQIPAILAVLRPIAKYSVTSVYRNQAVNRAVGGSPASRHMLGLAVDLGGLRGSKTERDITMLKSARELRSRGFRWVRAVYAELDRNHLHIEFWPPWEPPEGRPRYLVLQNGSWRQL